MDRTGPQLAEIRPRALSPAGVAAFIIVSSVTLPTGTMAIALGVGSMPLPYPLYLVLLRLPIAFPLHMIASGLALILIPFAVFVRCYPAVHRPIGRIVFCCILVGGLTALPVALSSEATTVARTGMLVQGVTWLALAVAAVGAIRSGNIAGHARRMIAMSAVASAAIWLRLVTTAAVVFQWPFDQVYAVAAWLCWIVPLAIALKWTKSPTLWQLGPSSR